LTLAGMATGTPAYMAPELARGSGDVDGRADLYSLGCVAYYLLTGRHVFQRKTVIETVLAHLNTEPERPGAVSEFNVPSALEALILQCLAKDPSARPSSAVILGERLAETVSSRPWMPDEAHTWWSLHRPAHPASTRDNSPPRQMRTRIESPTGSQVVGTATTQ
jgi:eukaryotic-like serine/threonine-protein kinase